MSSPRSLPDATPCTALNNRVSSSEQVPDLQDLEDREESAAIASLKMDFTSTDAVPSGELNRILWHAAKGWDVPYPRSEDGIQ